MIVNDVNITGMFRKISFPVRFRKTAISKNYFRFWLIPPKDAESNLRGGPC